MKSATLLNKLSEDAKMKVPLQTAWQECEKLTTPLIPLISVVLPLEIENFSTGQDSLNSSFFDSEEEFDDDDLVSPSGKKKRRRVKDFFTGKRQTEKKNEERARKARRVQEQARRVKEQALLFDKREERNAADKARRKPFFMPALLCWAKLFQEIAVILVDQEKLDQMELPDIRDDHFEHLY